MGPLIWVYVIQWTASIFILHFIPASPLHCSVLTRSPVPVRFLLFLSSPLRTFPVMSTQHGRTVSHPFVTRMHSVSNSASSYSLWLLCALFAFLFPPFTLRSKEFGFSGCVGKWAGIPCAASAAVLPPHAAATGGGALFRSIHLMFASHAMCKTNVILPFRRRKKSTLINAAAESKQTGALNGSDGGANFSTIQLARARAAPAPHTKGRVLDSSAQRI